VGVNLQNKGKLMAIQSPNFKDKPLTFIFTNFQWLLTLVILSGVFGSVVGVGAWVGVWAVVLLTPILLLFYKPYQ